MTSFRMISPGKTPLSPLSANGRIYSQAPGQSINVDAADEPILNAAGWTTIGQSGTTGERPTNLSPGLYGLSNPASRIYFDTSISKIIYHDGVTWRDPATGSAV